MFLEIILVFLQPPGTFHFFEFSKVTVALDNSIQVELKRARHEAHAHPTQKL